MTRQQTQTFAVKVNYLSCLAVGHHQHHQHPSAFWLKNPQLPSRCATAMNSVYTDAELAYALAKASNDGRRAARRLKKGMRACTHRLRAQREKVSAARAHTKALQEMWDRVAAFLSPEPHVKRPRKTYRFSCRTTVSQHSFDLAEVSSIPMAL